MLSTEGMAVVDDLYLDCELTLLQKLSSNSLERSVPEAKS
jgi:hypothetical protein